MQIYLGDYYLYSFNWQSAFRARYLAKNSLASEEHEKHDENIMEYGDNKATKGYWKAKLLVDSYT